jgi:hypothetical protein
LGLFATSFFLLADKKKEAKKNLLFGNPQPGNSLGVVHLNNIVGTKLLRLKIFADKAKPSGFIHFFSKKRHSLNWLRLLSFYALTKSLASKFYRWSTTSRYRSAHLPARENVPKYLFIVRSHMHL